MSTGILVYVDDKPEIIEEFHWLFKSVLFSRLPADTRIIAVCNPDAIGKIPQDELIIVIPSIPYSQRHERWRTYGFINSVANLCEEPVKEVASQFSHLLKTDCDTFVTPHLRGFEPANLCFGIGGYAYQQEVRDNLVRWSQRIGFEHSGIHNVGASVLGPAENVLEFLEVQRDFSERLKQEDFQESPGAWPGWFHGVLSMYAGELALRVLAPQRFSLGLLDHFCFSDRRFGNDVLHVHAWHTSSYFSKAALRAGEYDHMAIEDVDRSTLAGYCHYLAKVDLSALRAALNAEASG